MSRFALSMLLIAFLAGPIGCGNSALLSLSDAKKEAANKSHATGGVAVIDVDVVAKSLGRFDAIAQSVQQRESSLNRQLAEIQSSYRSQVEREERDLQTPANGNGNTQIEKLKSELNGRLVEARSKAQKDLEEYRAALVNRFREEVKPVAQKIASSKGLSLVVSKNDNVVFTFEPAIDITQDVVGQMQSAPPIIPGTDASH